MLRTRNIAIPLLLAAATAAPIAAQDAFNWQGRIASGRTLEIKGINGTINAVAASGTEARVTARKHARRGNTENVRIEVVEHDGGITLCAVYPTPRGRSANECRPGSGGRMNTEDNDVQVDFTVEVPAGVEFAATTVNGGIEASGITATVRATTVNGDVNVSTSHTARAKTVNGSIEVAMGRADWNGDLEFETVNGSIVIALPASASASVEASTVNGSIETDFPLTVSGRFGPRRVQGTIGAGGRKLGMSTVNGSIEIRRR